MSKIYVVTAVDSGDTCDGKARVLGLFKSEDEAKTYVHNDIESYCDMHAGEPGIECDFDKMYVRLDYGSFNGCEWNISEVEID